jgi:hypothetical protein
MARFVTILLLIAGSLAAQGPLPPAPSKDQSNRLREELKSFQHFDLHGFERGRRNSLSVPPLEARDSSGTCSIRLKEWKPQGNFAMRKTPGPGTADHMPTTKGPAPPCEEEGKTAPPGVLYLHVPHRR